MITPRTTQSARDVAEHYDELDPFYREIWGEHVHHGLWSSGRETPEEAVEALVDRLAAALALAEGETVCDIGCGYGASARRLAASRGVAVTGLTISAVQAARAGAASGEDARVRILNRDFLDNALPDEGFDAAYAIESSEHMGDKPRFFREAWRILKPGGRLGVYAWLAAERPGPAAVRHLLEPICREGRLPSLGSESEYRAFAAAAGLEVLGFEDLTVRVRRTWAICAGRVARKVATDPAYRRFLRDPRSRNRPFAASLLRIWLAYRTGAMRYGLLLARKP